MNRRSFLGAMVAAPIAAPAMVSAAMAQAPSMGPVTQIMDWSDVKLSGCYTADRALHYGRMLHTAEITRPFVVGPDGRLHMANVRITGSLPLTDGAGI